MSTWTAEPIFDGKATLWTRPDLDHWGIFDQPAGFYVWYRYTFCGEFPTLAEAQAHVETRAGQ